MYSPPQLCQPASSLAGRLSGFYFSRGYSSQIAEEVWFSHKEKKRALCYSGDRLWPARWWVGLVKSTVIFRKAQVSPKGEKTTWNRRWVSPQRPLGKKIVISWRETSWKQNGTISMSSLCIYWEATEFQQMGLRDWISRGDLSMSSAWFSGYPAPTESGPELSKAALRGVMQGPSSRSAGGGEKCDESRGCRVC